MNYTTRNTETNIVTRKKYKNLAKSKCITKILTINTNMDPYFDNSIMSDVFNIA
jgi:hypothetical protein